MPDEIRILPDAYPSHYRPLVGTALHTGMRLGSAGGGISCESASPTISSCTISGNSAGAAGGGIRIADANGVMVNSILWGDTAPSEPEVHLASGSLTATYSDVQGGPMPGEGNIDSDPLFVTPGDFQLAAGSPCIDLLQTARSST